jgi:Transglycosylase SLT domain
MTPRTLGIILGGALCAVANTIVVVGPVQADTYQPPPAILTHIRNAAARHNVSERLVYAMIESESRFNPNAVSGRGALGLMQLMPSTASMLRVRDALDPRQNIDAGVRHLRVLIDRFGGNLSLALAAYNAGEPAVLRHKGIPPYPETRQYVNRVLRLVRDASLPERAAITTAPVIRYRSVDALTGLSDGTPKPRVFDALASEWIKRDGRIVKIEGIRVRASGRSPRDTLVELAEVTLAGGDGIPRRHRLIFEEQRLVTREAVEERSAAVIEHADGAR